MFSSSLFLFFLRIRLPPISTLFPYTTLFRSVIDARLWVALRFMRVPEHLSPPRSPPPLRRIFLLLETGATGPRLDRKSTRLNSSHRCISYAVFCLKKKNDEDSKENGNRDRLT